MNSIHLGVQPQSITVRDMYMHMYTHACTQRIRLDKTRHSNHTQIEQTAARPAVGA